MQVFLKKIIHDYFLTVFSLSQINTIKSVQQIKFSFFYDNQKV